MDLCRALTPRLLIGLSLGLGTVWGNAASAQPPSPPPGGLGLDLEQVPRPADERPVLPEFQLPGPPSTGLELPPIVPHPEEERLSTGIQVFVRKFRLVGNTVFSDAELARVTAPYVGRKISSEELRELRHKLTRYYVNRGYINSGAIIPDQRIVEGVITLQIIEGELTDIEVRGNERLRAKYLKQRLALGAEPPLNLNSLQERLQLLLQTPAIDQLNAELGPGSRLGESILRVRMEEARPYSVAVNFNNRRSPALGEFQGEIEGILWNLTGWGDTLRARFAGSEGLKSGNVGYTLPITAYDTTLGVRFDINDSIVVEEPFDELDIASEANTLEFSLWHPFYRRPNQEFSMALFFARRRSRTFLLDAPFSFSPGVQDGKSKATVLRFEQAWLGRGRDQVLAARSLFSLGVDAFEATINETGPDGQFFSWLGQFQWAKRFGRAGHQIIFRSDLQLANDPLLPLEQFAMGGATTVRGYRENLLVRDNGAVVSLEGRIPAFQLPIPGLEPRPAWGIVQLAPFVDFGVAWNTGRPTPDPKTISSAGVGLRWDPTPWIHGELYWGYAFRDITVADAGLQDSGIHFVIGLSSR